ncbi:MAG: hypothetical protein Q7V20_22975 [Aquabacterium sp.]|uniref:hypothetical protein n=1 Tax=Aquabacterium sp. TaxID=1872578 RepID=UPI00271FFEC9|nr:hypothetical protein [Aquabacterium sp.]MDO9006317.1 hypothetical protein [Aquabacterium sp.]
MSTFGIPDNAAGIRLAVLRAEKAGGERLDLCETIIFSDGAKALDTILRRAQICGWVGRYGQDVGDGHHFADLMQENGDSLDVLPMSRAAWNYIKRKTKARLDPVYKMERSA